MKVKITLNCDNAAFEDYPATEVARILRKLAGDIEGGCESKPLRDVNGNTVGEYKISK